MQTVLTSVKNKILLWDINVHSMSLLGSLGQGCKVSHVDITLQCFPKGIKVPNMKIVPVSLQMFQRPP